MIPKWAADITEADIRHPLVRELIDAVGLDGALRLVDTFGGSTLYIPQLEKTLAACRDRHIRAEYNGTNTKRLASTYGVSDSWVMRVVGEAGKLTGQMDMFDML